MWDVQGDTIIVCGAQFGWASKEDVVHEILNQRAAYVVPEPTIRYGPLVSVLEDESGVQRLTTDLGGTTTNLLDTLPVCNVADFGRHIFRK